MESSVIRILMKRDGLTKKEAVEYYKELREEIHECLKDGGRYDEVEDLLMSEGFEMDYIFEFI